MSTTAENNEGKLPTGLFIDNQFVPSICESMFQVCDPVTGDVICSVSEAQKEDVDAAVFAAASALIKWRRTTPTNRGKLLHKLADLIERDSALLADLEARNSGKLACIARSVDLPATVNTYRYYGGWADKLPDGRTIDIGDEGMLAYTRCEPFGIVGCIIPWNYVGCIQ